MRRWPKPTGNAAIEVLAERLGDGGAGRFQPADVRSRHAPDRLPQEKHMARERLFDPGPGKIPMFMYDSAMVGPKATARLDFGRSDDPTAPRLVDLVEDRVRDLLLAVPIAHQFLHEALGFDPPGAQGTWYLLGAQRRLICRDSPTGKPEELDLIMGPVRDGHVHFDELAEVEVKLRKVDADGRPRSTASGGGTMQAQGTAELGFDRTLLLHVLVSEEREMPAHYAATWRSIVNSQSLRAIKASIGAIVKSESGDIRPYGYALASWGQVPGARATDRGTVHCPIVRQAPFRPLHLRSDVVRRANSLRDGLKNLLSNLPTARFFRHCQRCPRLFGSACSLELLCDEHR